MACKKYLLNSVRILNFFRFLGLEEPSWESDDFDFYLGLHATFDDASKGLALLSSHSRSLRISVSKVLDSLKKKLAAKYGSANIELLIQDLRRSGLLAGSMDDGNATVDFDEVAVRLIGLNISQRDQVKSYVYKVFLSTDLDNDESIEWDEFKMVYRYLEPTRFDEKAVQTLFMEESDIINKDQERSISLNKFASVCHRYGLFTEEAQRKFLEKEEETLQTGKKGILIKDISDLKEKWAARQEELKLLLGKSHSFNAHFKNIFKNFTTVLQDKKLMDNHKDAIWIRFKMVCAEVKRIYLDYKVTKYISPELGIIHQHATDLLGL